MRKWEKWLADRRDQSVMVVVPKPLYRLGGGWGDDDETGYFARKDGKFFRLIGVGVHGFDFDDPTYDLPMLEERGDGVVVLVQDKYDGSVLLRARVEPGNPATYSYEGANPHSKKSKRHVLLGPTLQASEANLERAHGGSGPPRAELHQEPGVIWYDQSMDGGRYYQKTVRVGLLLVDAQDALGHLAEDERWFSVYEFSEAMLQGECNPFVSMAFALSNVVAAKGMG